MTRVGIAEEGGREAAAGLMEQLAEQIDQLARLQVQADSRSSQLDQRIGSLTEALERLAEGQTRLVAQLGESGGPGTIDAESRMRLRSIDVQLLKILEEIAAGRQEALHDLRADIAHVAAALSGARRA